MHIITSLIINNMCSCVLVSLCPCVHVSLCPCVPVSLCPCVFTKLFFYFFREFSYLNDYHSCLKFCIFTKLSQTMSVINTQILICQYSRCDYKLLVAPWFSPCVQLFICPSVALSLCLHETFFLFSFSRIFILKWLPFMLEVLYLHQTFTDYESN